MAKVAFSPAAQADLDKTAAYMRNVLRNPGAARKFVQDMRQHIQILRDFPEMGTPFTAAFSAGIMLCVLTAILCTLTVSCTGGAITWRCCSATKPESAATRANHGNGRPAF